MRKREGRGKKEREREKEEEREKKSKKKNGKVENKIVKGEEENLQWKEGGKYEMNREPFFFFACHFLKPLKFVWGVPKWKFKGKIF